MNGKEFITSLVGDLEKARWIAKQCAEGQAEKIPIDMSKDLSDRINSKLSILCININRIGSLLEEIEIVESSKQKRNGLMDAGSYKRMEKLAKKVIKHENTPNIKHWNRTNSKKICSKRY